MRINFKRINACSRPINMRYERNVPYSLKGGIILPHHPPHYIKAVCSHSLKGMAEFLVDHNPLNRLAEHHWFVKTCAEQTAFVSK